MAEFILKNVSDYNEVYRNKNTGFATGYYSVNDIKARFPDGGIRVAGQIKCGDDEIGSITVGDVSEKVYRVTSSKRYKITGYIELESGEFLVIKKDILAVIILLILLGLLLLAGLAVGITYGVRANTDVPPETTTDPRMIDTDAEWGEGYISVPEKIETEGRKIKVNGIPEMRLKADTLEQNFVFSNPQENPCYFVVEVELIDTGEIIYTSNLLPPGYSISKFRLNRTLKEGSYKAVVHYKTYTFDKEQRPLNNMDIKTTIKAS